MLYISMHLVINLGDFAEVNCGYSSSGNVLTLEFTSDETTTSSGFRAKANILRSQSSTPGICVLSVLVFLLCAVYQQNIM